MSGEGGRGRLILIVDDDVALLRSLGRLLRGAGEVVTAATYDEGIVCFEARPPSHTIADYQLLDERTGLNFLAEVGAKDPALRKVIYTGVPLFAGPRMDLGGIPFLRKPAEDQLLDFVMDRGAFARPNRKTPVPSPALPPKRGRTRIPTPSEETALYLGAIGLPRALVADALGKDTSTIRAQQETALSKLGLSGMKEATKSVGRGMRRDLAKALHELAEEKKRSRSE